jgi:hypothetical protein
MSYTLFCHHWLNGWLVLNLKKGSEYESDEAYRIGRLQVGQHSRGWVFEDAVSLAMLNVRWYRRKEREIILVTGVRCRSWVKSSLNIVHKSSLLISRVRIYAVNNSLPAETDCEIPSRNELLCDPRSPISRNRCVFTWPVNNAIPNSTWEGRGVEVLPTSSSEAAVGTSN